MTKSQTAAKPPTDRRGSFGLTIAFGAAGLVLAIIVTGGAYLILPAAFPGVGMQWVEGQAFGLLAFVAALITVIGLILRAGAHNRDDRRNWDYLGKLFSASTSGFVIIGALVRIDLTIYYWVGGSVVVISIVTIYLCLRQMRK